MKRNAARKIDLFSSIWDIPKLDLQELKQLMQEVPFDTLRLALLDVTDEIRTYVYNAATPVVAEQLKAFILLKQMLLEKEVIKGTDILEAQAEIGKVMEKLFQK